jgi:hypothetical protein
MRDKKTVVIVAFFTALAFVFVGCTQFTPEITEIISQEQIDKLEESGMEIYEGTAPPNLEGVYYMDSPNATFDSTDVYPSVFSYYFKFYDQTLDDEITVDYNGGGGIDVATGRGAFISGRLNNFSIFVEQKGETQGVTYRQASVYSGVLGIGGIREWQLGIIMLEKEGDPNDSVLMPVDARRVYEESDGLVAKVSDSEWPGTKSIEKYLEKTLDNGNLPLNAAEK